jgi:hypothetical protein
MVVFISRAPSTVDGKLLLLYLIEVSQATNNSCIKRSEDTALPAASSIVVGTRRKSGSSPRVASASSLEETTMPRYFEAATAGQEIMVSAFCSFLVHCKCTIEV